jgi:hypothetical protein
MDCISSSFTNPFCRFFQPYKKYYDIIPSFKPIYYLNWCYCLSHFLSLIFVRDVLCSLFSNCFLIYKNEVKRKKIENQTKTCFRLRLFEENKISKMELNSNRSLTSVFHFRSQPKCCMLFRDLKMTCWNDALHACIKIAL